MGEDALETLDSFERKESIQPSPDLKMKEKVKMHDYPVVNTLEIS